MVSRPHSLLVNLLIKHRNRNVKHEKRKKQVAQMVSYQTQPGSCKQRSLCEDAAWLSLVRPRCV